MEQSKQDRLKAHGWQIGSVSDFLGLSTEEAEYIQVKLALSQEVRAFRQRQGWTQDEVARLVGSSQSRVAKMEVGDPSVSIDLLMKTLIALGVSRQEIANTIGADSFAAA